MHPGTPRQRAAHAAFVLAAALFAYALIAEGEAVSPECPAAQFLERASGPGQVARVYCEDGGSRQRLGEGRFAEDLLFGGWLDLNRAEAQALEALPGIGPARARAIAAARPFSSLDELERVRGIGPKTRAALSPWLRVEPRESTR